MSIRRAVILALVVVGAAVLVAVVRWQPTPDQPRGPTTGLRIIVVAVDGMDGYLLARFAANGGLPFIEYFHGGGFVGEIAADTPALPEVGWTRFARGRALTHEELSLAAGRGDGQLLGVTPEVAQAASESGASVLCVGWPASWPADPTAGAIVAGYAPPAEKHALALPAAFFEGGPGQASTENGAKMVDEIVRRNEGIYEAEFERQILEGDVGGDAVIEEHLVAARWAFLSDMINLDLGGRLIAELEPDLSLVYLGGLDVVSHRFLAPAVPEFFPDLPQEASRYGSVLPNYYRFIDTALARLHRLRDDRTVFVICSVYGVHPSEDDVMVSGSHDRGPPGVLMVRGPSIKRSEQPTTIGTADLVPTVLSLLGLPIPDGVQGRVVPEVLPQGLLSQFPETRYRSTKHRHEAPSGPLVSEMQALADSRMERLRADVRN